MLMMTRKFILMVRSFSAKSFNFNNTTFSGRPPFPLLKELTEDELEYITRYFITIINVLKDNNELFIQVARSLSHRP
jgi:hypothetical protein